MKKIFAFSTIIFGAIFLLQSCAKDYVTETYTMYKPIYMDRALVQQSIKSTTPVTLDAPGKIFIQGNYVYLNEVNKGVHIINMANPASPQKVSFINIPGCIDIAVNGNYLYADCNTDLVTLNIANPLQVSVANYKEKVFPNKYYYNWLDTNRMVVGWEKKDTIIKRRIDEVISKDNWGGVLLATAQSSGGTSAAAIPSGKGGSTARMAILNNRLYYVSSWQIIIHSIAAPATPAYTGTVSLYTTNNAETIFPMKNNLFIGSMNGMSIYDATNPDAPQYKSGFSHARLCDPVIADGDYAYVTLRSGTACEGTENELDVLNISSITTPTFVKKYNLTSPSGLSKDGNVLIICDGSAGLKFFDAADPNNITMTKTMPGLQPNDVIATNGKAVATTNTGLYFLKYSTPSDATQEGAILVGN